MTQVSDIKSHYRTEFERFASNGVANDGAWIQQLRHDAMARFADLRFPTTRDEEWRFTNVTPIINVPFRAAHGNDRPAVTGQQIAPFIVGDETWSRLVFINGRYSADLSSIGPLPAGVRVANLAE